MDPMMLKKELKVIFVGEEGVDEGGVKKEFFQLLVERLFDFDYGMFRLSESKREIWFNKDCDWSGDEYHLVGILIGLAIYNAVLLDLHFPRAVYKKLLGLPLGLADLEDIEPELMTGLRKLLEYRETPGGATIQDVFCLTFEVSGRNSHLAPCTLASHVGRTGTGAWGAVNTRVALRPVATASAQCACMPHQVIWPADPGTDDPPCDVVVR
jgi:hypothetical protein